MKQVKKHPATAGSWPVAFRWLAGGTLAVYTALGCQVLKSAQAPAVAQSVLRRFDIAAGPIENVLVEYRLVTGVEVQLASDGIARIQSPGVTGMFTPEQALTRIVGGTQLRLRFVGRDAAILELAPVQQSVEVREQLGPSLPQYSAPLRDVPQTVTVIPRSVMEQQGATSLRDVLRNVPGLTITAGEGGAPAGDNLTLRGFSARNDLFVDGVRDLSPQSRDPFNLEQVEVIKGPSSAYTGRGSTGGVVNLVSRSPGTKPLFGFSLLGGTDATRRLATDVNTPVPFLGARTAFRLNTVNHASDVAGRNEVSNGRWGVAPSLTFGVGTPTRLTLSYYKLRQSNTPDYGIPWVPATNNALAAYRDQPAPVPRDSWYGLASRDRERTGSDMGTVRIEHQTSDAFGIRDQFRYSRSTRDSITTAPRFASNDSLVINRSSPSWITKDQVYDNQTDVRAQFHTGALKHSVNTGVALTRESNIRFARTAAGVPTTTLYEPSHDATSTGTLTLSPTVGDLKANSQSLYAFDTVEVGRLQLNGGLRFDRFAVDGVNTTNVRLARTDKMAGVRAGAVYRVAPAGNVYVSYGTSINPSLEGLSYQPADTTVEPEKSYTVEAGTKWDVGSGRLSLTGAVFRVEKKNARTPGATPDDPPVVLNGRQRVNGIELGAGGMVTRKLQVFGGYTLMDSTVVSSNTPGETGKRMINTPRHSLNLWATWSPLQRLQIGGGVRVAGKRYGNTTNTRSVDAYATLDGMASYRVNRHLDLRLNLYNLNNAYYFDRLGGGHLIPGPARSAVIGTNFTF